MQRFYCPEFQNNSIQAILKDPQEIHHLKNVLRKKVNDEIFVFNGNGIEAKAIIEAINSKEIRCQLKDFKENFPPKPKFILACAMPKKSKFETIIEKATELGVDEIIPLQTERSEVVLKKERMEKQLERFRIIALNASKQSQRNFLPHIQPMMKLSQCLENLKNRSVVIMPSLMGQRGKLLKVFNDLKAPQAISFLIGPEGDFTEEEYIKAHQDGAIPVSLGETILKVETAALSVLSCANVFFRS